TFDVNITSEKPWTIEGEVPTWFTISATSGNGGGRTTVTFTTTEDNYWAFERTATLTLKSEDAAVSSITLTVEQQPATPKTTFSTRYVMLDWQQGSAATIEMQSNERWSVTYNMPEGYWQVNPTSGEGNATLTITALNDNNSESNLDGIFKLNNKEIYVVQKFNAKPLAVSADCIRLGAQKGSTVQVQVTTDTEWELEPVMGEDFSDWLSVSPMAGKGNATVTFTTKRELTDMLNNVAAITLTGKGAYPVTLIVEQAAEQMPQGKGSKEEPYLISSFDHLMWMSANTAHPYYNSPDAHYRLTGDIDARASHTVDGGFPGIPHYHSREPFNGSFNGKGYAIKNFKSTMGLFTATSGIARIDSMALVNVTVQGSDIGGLVTRNYGTINACYVTGFAMGNNCGLIAYVSDGYITSCYAAGRLEGRNSGITHNGGNVEYCYAVTAGLPDLSYAFNSTSTGNVSGYYNSDIFRNGTASPSADVKGLSTNEMTHQASFTGWDFDNMWTITETTSLPRIRGVYNYSLLSPTYETTAQIGELYETTIIPLSMDGGILSIRLTDAPEGMTMDEYNTIRWTPTSGGLYYITVTITDANSRTVDYTIPISVMLMGEGTADKPYLIHTIGELNTMRYMEPVAHFRLMNDLDFAGSDYSKENSEQGWLPLSFGGDMHGMPKMPFSGHFHGGGHTIKNLYINRPTSDGIGLFIGVDNGSIDSLGLENVHVVGNEFVGALCGKTEAGHLTHCYATGTVHGFKYVGGLVGEATMNSTLTRCYANVSVRGTSRIENEREVVGNSFGALAGRFDFGNIESCYAAGSVRGAQMAGGMCGSLTRTTITNCYTTAVGREADGVYFGIASFNDYNTVTNTYSYQPTFASEFYAAYGVTAIDLVQIKEQASYTDWDFANTWEITEGQTLPRLRGMKNFPVLLPVKDVAQINTKYLCTLNMIQMGSPVSKFSISGVEGMTFAEEGSTVVKWTPATAAEPTLTVSIKAENGDHIAISTQMEVIPFAGEGTLDNPYQITTIAQLDAVRRYADKHFKLMNDLDFNGSEFSKENSRYGWNPIADFSGQFNGNGHIIKNLYINTPNSGTIDGAGVGLFAKIIFGAEIGLVYNLGLVNVDIRNNNPAYNTGAICGTISGNGNIYTSIHHCYVTGTVYGNDQRTGGIVGSIEDRATVDDCYSHATVTIPGDQPSGALGGIAGYNSNGRIFRCYATGRVMVKNPVNTAIVGTICGMNYGANAEISNCHTMALGDLVGANRDGAQSTDNTFLYPEHAKNQASYVGWDFIDSGWAIAEGESMPALTIMSNNAPAAFHSGWINVGARMGMDRLLPFGYDNETARQKLVAKPIDWNTEYFYSDGHTYVGIKPGVDEIFMETECFVNFQIGEVIAPADTLWGGTAIANIKRGQKNSQPTGGTGTVTITEDSALEGYDALANASDPHGDYLTLVRINEGYPLHGTATIDNNRISYQPEADYNGTDEIRYMVTDGEYEGEGLINVTITAVNDAPVLTAVSEKSVNEDNSLTLTLNDVTATDVDGDALSLVIASGDNYTVNGNTITPAENFHGTLSVGIAVTDGTLTSTQMVMEITVLPVNDIPVLTAVADLTMNEDESITITMDDVTASDADGDELQIVIDPEASGGEKSSAGAKGQNYTVSGTTITPAKDFHGELKVNVGVRDKFAGTPPMVMTITVLPINDAPVLNAVSTHVLPEDESIPLSMYDVAATDVDNAQDELLLIVYEGENYTVNGTTVTPAANFHGTLNVPLAVSDGELTSNQMVMVITINSVNDAPVLTAVSNKEMSEDESITLTLADVTATDAEGDQLQLVIANGENYTVNGNTITPDADFHGTLQVSIAVTDGELTSNQMAMEITVHNVYDAPVLHTVANKTINEDEMLELTINDVTATWVDDNIENLLVVIANCEPHTVAENTLIPVQDFNGTIEISVALFDGSNYSNYVTSTLTVLSVNDEP
ncbi:MAG: tandem-95 repeat protein, partial [Tenuifilaceae bacterium]|nr:tandem-95 repeat protein [Tenuifilaceae bacterium]